MAFASQYKDLNIPIKKVYAEPNEASKVIFEIPIEVRALGVSEDRNWFKVKIKIDLVFFGNYEYIGWVNIPIASLLKEASQEAAPLPAALD